MEKNEAETNSSQGFFSGFVIGGVVSGLAFYLTMTEPGRKITRALLRKSEELGEKGEDYLQSLLEEQTTGGAKQKGQKKIKKVMNQLKGEI